MMVLRLQSTVGTVVKSGDHGDPVGVLTALNTQRYKDAPCMRDIKAFILRHCTSESTKADLEKVSDSLCESPLNLTDFRTRSIMMLTFALEMQSLKCAVMCYEAYSDVLWLLLA